MTISANISLFAQVNSQVNRLNDLRSMFDNLQRQATTQKKYETFSGFGPDSFSLQRLHTEQTLTQSYLDNIDKVSNRMNLQDKAMTQMSGIANQLINAITLQVQGGVTDMTSINLLARQGLDFMQNLLNLDLDGHYLFAGSDVTSQPFIDNATLNSNFANQVASWLGGAQTTAQMITTTDAFTATNLGLSPALATAGTMTARIDDNLDIDYTTKADQTGFQQVLRALGMMANLKYPDPMVDIATPAEFQQVIDHVLTVATEGLQGIKDTNQQLASKFNLVKAVKDNHVSDMALLTTQIDKMENADPTTVIASMQALQTQLTASYQVTRAVSQMSLVNFL